MDAPAINTTLNDGTVVSLHSIDSCDRQCIVDAFENLSCRTRQSRYHIPIKKLPNSYLKSLLRADNKKNVVVVAHYNDGEQEYPAGLARYVCLEGEPGAAEFSITITDDYQGKGLGTQMLKYLVAHAQTNQISILRGYVLSSNKPMIKILDRYNCSIQNDDDGTLFYEIDVSSNVLT
jgi:GNAT superfamily N-acetyltransferase